MLKLKVKRNEMIFIDFEEKRVGLMVVGYKGGAYHVVASGPKDVKITHQNAKKQETNIKERANDSAEV